MANGATDRDGKEAMNRLSQQGLSIAHGPSQPALMHKTLGRLLKEQAAQRPSASLVIVEHQQRSLTYAEADRRSDDLAKGLRELGVQKREPVAILMGNEIEYIEVTFACAKIGAYLTLVNYGYTEQELHSVLSTCRATTLILVPEFGRYSYKSWLPTLKTGIPSLKHIVVVLGDDQDAKAGVAYEDVINTGRGSTHDLHAVEGKLGPRDIINLQFTSGSTGSPKASALTHFGITNAGRFIGNTMYLQSCDRICLPVPLFHAFGLVIGLVTATVYGASIALPSSEFEADAALACIAKHRCTCLYGVTTMFIAQMSLPAFASYDLSSLRVAVLAGSVVPEELLRRVWSAYGITQTHTNWGLTEASSICTMTRDTDSIHQRTITSGRLFPHFSAKIVDAVTGRAVRYGERGEIVLRGYGVQECYFRNEEKTAEAHRVSIEDSLEWFHTGDEGYIDADGFFVITGRLKDMIIRGGEKIAPNEIERRIAAHPAVAQVSVIGVPDEKYGEAVCAFLELSLEGKAPKPHDEEIRAWVRETMARYKQPALIICLGSHSQFSSWPKTASGKIRKPDLRKLAARISAGQKEGNPPRARL